MPGPFIESTLYGGTVKVKFFPESHRYYVDGKQKPGVTTIIGAAQNKAPVLLPWAADLCETYLLGSLAERSITEEDIIKASWFYDDKKKQAADLGKEIHAWCEAYIKSKLGLGEMPEMPERKEVQIGAAAFLDWEKAHHVQFLSTERVVYSKQHGFIGTMDIEAIVDGKHCLIDIKSGNGIYNDVRMQTAAYLKADVEERDTAYENRWVIRLSKETEEEYLERMERKNRRRDRNGTERAEIEPYVVFQAKSLDDSPDDLERDWQAFLAAKTLYDWNAKTRF